MGTELTIRDRIKFVLSHKNKSINEFADGNDTLRIRITRQLNGTNDVSLEVAQMVLDKYQDISAEWLMRGTSGMFIKDHEATRVYNTNGSIYSIGNKGSQNTCNPNEAAMQETIRLQEQIIQMKDSEVKYRDGVIQALNDDKRSLNNQLSMLMVKIKKQ